MSDSYPGLFGDELIHRVGANHAAQILILEPLFEEANRTRRMIAQIMKLLDGSAIGTSLPNLPGTGESLVPLDGIRFSDWRDAVRSVADMLRPAMIVSLRGGCLLDDVEALAPRWRFAPETGARIIRDLERTRLTGQGDPNFYGGNSLSVDFVDDLRSVTPTSSHPTRVVRLDTDAQDADVKYAGSPLWRRAEPGEDLALSTALAHDIRDWVQICAAS